MMVPRLFDVRSLLKIPVLITPESIKFKIPNEPSSLVLLTLAVDEIKSLKITSEEVLS